MKLSAYKGQVIIEGKESEYSKIEALADKMVEIDSDLALVEGGCECGESFVTLSYDSSYMTVKEVRETYKQAKSA